MVPARPFFIGSDGWVRSNAWIWLFSSMHSTTACSGGSRYKPTTSVSLNAGSLETLKVSTRCGFSPRAFQIRCTVLRLTPACLAIDLVLQWVSPLGLECSVASTISSTFSAGIDGFGPRPLRTSPSLARPSSANRFRQARTVTVVTPTSAAIRALATPSAASSNAFARCTCRCGADRARANTSNASR
jgi:hypothetical protein